MQIGTATVESSMELAQKIENEASFWLRNSTSGKKHETLTQKNIITPMFIAALFTIAKIWKQPKCLSVDEWIKQVWDIYTME